MMVTSHPDALVCCPEMMEPSSLAGVVTGLRLALQVEHLVVLVNNLTCCDKKIIKIFCKNMKVLLSEDEEYK
jgi:hypothetical protein